MKERRSFMATIADLRKGQVQDELTDKLSELVSAVSDTGRPGTLTLTISVKLTEKDSNVMRVDAKAVLKKPEYDRPATLMFNNKGTLQLDDPDAEQHRGTVRGVETPAPKQVREVGNG